MVELPHGLDELVDLALRVDARLQQRDLRGRRRLTPRYHFLDTGDTVSHSSVDEPMQVGRARLSREERDRQRMRGLCLYCGAAGNFLVSCPVKKIRPDSRSEATVGWGVSQQGLIYHPPPGEVAMGRRAT